MTIVCSCGENLVINTSQNTFSTYCISCGSESSGRMEKGMEPYNEPTEKVALSRALILKKIKNKEDEEEKAKNKLERDRTNYLPQRGRR